MHKFLLFSEKTCPLYLFCSLSCSLIDDVFSSDHLFPIVVKIEKVTRKQELVNYKIQAGTPSLKFLFQNDQ